MQENNIQEIVKHHKEMGFKDKQDFVFGENQFAGLSQSEKEQKYLQKSQQIANQYNHITPEIIKAYFWTENELLNITDQTGRERFENANKALSQIIEANKTFINSENSLSETEKGIHLFKKHALDIEDILQKNNVKPEERFFLGVILQDHYQYGFIPFQIKQIQQGHLGYKVQNEDKSTFIREFINSLQQDHVLPGEELTYRYPTIDINRTKPQSTAEIFSLKKLNNSSQHNPKNSYSHMIFTSNEKREAEAKNVHAFYSQVTNLCDSKLMSDIKASVCLVKTLQDSMKSLFKASTHIPGVHEIYSVEKNNHFFSTTSKNAILYAENQLTDNSEMELFSKAISLNMPQADLKKNEMSHPIINSQFSRIVNGLNTSFSHGRTDMSEVTQFIIDRVKASYLVLLDLKIKNNTLIHQSHDISESFKFNPQIQQLFSSLDDLDAIRKKINISNSETQYIKPDSSKKI